METDNIIFNKTVHPCAGCTWRTLFTSPWTSLTRSRLHGPSCLLYFLFFPFLPFLLCCFCFIGQSKFFRIDVLLLLCKHRNLGKTEGTSARAYSLLSSSLLSWYQILSPSFDGLHAFS